MRPTLYDHNRGRNCALTSIPYCVPKYGKEEHRPLQICGENAVAGWGQPDFLRDEGEHLNKLGHVFGVSNNVVAGGRLKVAPTTQKTSCLVLSGIVG